MSVDWCAAHNIVLKTEDDGRMFPITDSSRTVIDAMLTAATCAGATIRTKCGATTARRENDRFVVTLDSGVNVRPQVASRVRLIGCQ